MHKIILTFRQRVSLTMLIKTQVGNRKDLSLQVLRDIRKRAGLTNKELDNYIRPLSNDRAIVDIDAISKQPDLEFELTNSEAKLLLAKLDEATLSVDDMEDWADDFASKLQEVIK